MKSLEELAKIREAALSKPTDHHKMIITIGMATCGITAGARPVLTALLEAMVEDENETVQIRQTGCFGKCQAEPMIELKLMTGEHYYYGHMTPEAVVDVYRHHCLSQEAVKAYLIEME